MRISVDLPAPLGPSRPNMPAGWRGIRRQRARPFAYVLDRCSMRRSMRFRSETSGDVFEYGPHCWRQPACLRPAYHSPESRGAAGGGGHGVNAKLEPPDSPSIVCRRRRGNSSRRPTICRSRALGGLVSRCRSGSQLSHRATSSTFGAGRTAPSAVVAESAQQTIACAHHFGAECESCVAETAASPPAR